MKNRRIMLTLSLLLIVTLLISGCPPFRRPEPERQPAPAPAPAPEIQAPQQQPAVPAPDLNIQPRQPGPEAMDLAEQIADAATRVEGVDTAVALVISNLAMVGITLDRGTARNEVEIKREVAKIVEERQPRIASAYVSANPDIIRQLQEISRGIQRGEPISTFFEQIGEVLRRMRAETNT
ncbi:MAG: YhcN/YlaJ family sporulation lipoprotein [Dethiobacter sp.]|nr:YhcN/YlaJ family sporulation lipoprotein [Dethiobacter sp.]